jgi:SnoaL-like domain
LQLGQRHRWSAPARTGGALDSFVVVPRGLRHRHATSAGASVLAVISPGHAVPHLGDRWYLDLDPAAVHQRYIDATNRGDVAGAVALFAQDAVYQGGSCQPDPCVGQAGIQGDNAGNVASHVRVTRLSAQVDGDTLTWRSEVVADGVRAAGVERIITLGTTQVRAATIVKHHFRFDISDPQTAVYADFLGARQGDPAPDAPAPGS